MVTILFSLHLYWCRVPYPYDLFLLAAPRVSPGAAVFVSSCPHSNNNLSKRFLIDKAIYNSLADLPSKGSCFGVIGNAPISIGDSFSIPAYSRFAFINTGDSTDGALLAIDSNGNIYSVYRNNGIWNTGQVSASKSDLTQYITVEKTTDAYGQIALDNVYNIKNLFCMGDRRFASWVGDRNVRITDSTGEVIKNTAVKVIVGYKS